MPTEPDWRLLVRRSCQSRYGRCSDEIARAVLRLHTNSDADSISHSWKARERHRTIGARHGSPSISSLRVRRLRSVLLKPDQAAENPEADETAEASPAALLDLHRSSRLGVAAR